MQMNKDNRDNGTHILKGIQILVVHIVYMLSHEEKHLFLVRTNKNEGYFL